MTNLKNIAPIDELKAQAKRLRDSLRDAGQTLSHGKALELIAHQHGARDWNTLCGLAGNQMILRVGDRVEGRYLGQPFVAEIRGLSTMGDGAHRRITLHFEDPVDVVRFDSFSSYRQRVSGEIGWDGRSVRRTSDGEPHLVVRPM